MPTSARSISSTLRDDEGIVPYKKGTFTMKRKIIITAVIALIAGIVLGTAAGFAIAARVDMDKLTGSVINSSEIVQTTEDYDIYYADENGNATGEAIGRCEKATYTQTTEGMFGKKINRVVSMNYKYVMTGFDNKDMLVRVFSVTTHPPLPTDISDYRTLALTEENNFFYITYSPRTIELPGGMIDNADETVDYFIECNNTPTVLVER